MDYIFDFEEHEEFMQKISPNHYYGYLMGSLRGKWRNILAEWTRNSPLEGAWAEIDPKQTIAGQEKRLTLSIFPGEHLLKEGSRIAVVFPPKLGGEKNANHIGYFGGSQPNARGIQVVAKHENDGVVLETVIHSIGSMFTCAEIFVVQGEIVNKKPIKLVIGDNKEPLICELRNTFTFRVAIDLNGDGDLRPLFPYPSIENVGVEAKQLQCYVSPAPRNRKSVDLQVVAGDLVNGNPDHFLNGKATLKIGFSTSGWDEIREVVYEHGVAKIEGLILPNKQARQIRVLDEDNLLIGQSNYTYPELLDEYSLYYGDLHVHTDLSDGMGSLTHAYRWGRDVAKLDFAAISDHMSLNQSYNYTMQDKWEMAQEAAEQFNEPGKFVTLNGYELYVSKHRNIYFPNEGVLITDENDKEELTLDNLKTRAKGEDFVFIPHSVDSWDTEMLSENQTVVELTQLGEAKVQEALKLGYKVGFVGLSDNHIGEPANGRGIAGLYAPELTRESIFSALKKRRTYATNGPRIILTFFVNDLFMGEEKQVEQDNLKRNIQGRVISPEPITKIEIIRNDEVIKCFEGENKDFMDINYHDEDSLNSVVRSREKTGENSVYYYLRVQTAKENYAWSSPVWFTV